MLQIASKLLEQIPDLRLYRIIARLQTRVDLMPSSNNVLAIRGIRVYSRISAAAISSRIQRSSAC